MKIARILSVLVAVSCISFTLVACGDTGTTQLESNTESKSETQDSSDASADKVICDDSFIKVTYNSLKTMPGMEGQIYLNCTYENKTDKTVTVYPTESYVNDTQVTMVSGVPTTMKASGKSNNAISFNGQPLGITDTDDVQKVEMKFMVVDEDNNTLETTDTISIPLE